MEWIIIHCDVYIFPVARQLVGDFRRDAGSITPIEHFFRSDLEVSISTG